MPQLAINPNPNLTPARLYTFELHDTAADCLVLNTWLKRLQTYLLAKCMKLQSVVNDNIIFKALILFTIM